MMINHRQYLVILLCGSGTEYHVNNESCSLVS